MRKSNKRRRQNSSSSIEFELKHVSPLNERQVRVLGSDRNLVLSGFAGTGKTFLSSYVAYQDIVSGIYNKVVYMRSAVPTRNIGFLPGNEKEKVEVYEAPYIDIASELFGRGDAYQILKLKGVVHFMSTSFIRGVTLRDAVIIVDETQNMTYHELDSLITRLGDNCRIIFCGDIRQSDLYKNGFEDFYQVITSMDEFDFIEFHKEDIVRSALVKSYIIKKDEILNKR
jgi:phosphate starvation-inducible PhoH-like protein